MDFHLKITNHSMQGTTLLVDTNLCLEQAESLSMMHGWYYLKLHAPPTTEELPIHFHLALHLTLMNTQVDVTRVLRDRR